MLRTGPVQVSVSPIEHIPHTAVPPRLKGNNQFLPLSPLVLSISVARYSIVASVSELLPFWDGHRSPTAMSQSLSHTAQRELDALFPLSCKGQDATNHWLLELKLS
jgi:hypothetical protein